MIVGALATVAPAAPAAVLCRPALSIATPINQTCRPRGRIRELVFIIVNLPAVEARLDTGEKLFSPRASLETCAGKLDQRLPRRLCGVLAFFSACPSARALNLVVV
jgi:hypothetical protein